MPEYPKRMCTRLGCKELQDNQGLCKQHLLAKYAKHDAARGTTNDRGYGSDWQKLRVSVLKRDKGLCQQCKRDGYVNIGSEVDHIVPKQNGGTDSLTNLQTLCHACHAKKTAMEKRCEITSK